MSRTLVLIYFPSFDGNTGYQCKPPSFQLIPQRLNSQIFHPYEAFHSGLSILEETSELMTTARMIP